MRSAPSGTGAEVLVHRINEAVDANVLLAAFNESDAATLVAEEHRRAADRKVNESMVADL